MYKHPCWCWATRETEGVVLSTWPGRGRGDVSPVLPDWCQISRPIWQQWMQLAEASVARLGGKSGTIWQHCVSHSAAPSGVVTHTHTHTHTSRLERRSRLRTFPEQHDRPPGREATAVMIDLTRRTHGWSSLQPPGWVNSAPRCLSSGGRRAGTPPPGRGQS